MNIDKNNWFIREDDLTEDQYVEVCKYLVENYEDGENTAKIMDAAKRLQVDHHMSTWHFVGVLGGYYTSSEGEYKSSVSVITYQQFLEHIKGSVSTVSCTPDTPSENPWIDWKGGECPVDPDTPVQVLLGCGLTPEGLAEDYDWRHNEHPDCSIIKYRVLSDTNSTSVTESDPESDTNPPVSCENPSQSLTDTPKDTLEWMFELDVERVEADSETITITHKRIGKIVMDVTVDFKDIKSMLEGLEEN